MKERRNYMDQEYEEEPAIEQVFEVRSEKPARPKSRTGHITGCDLLNVRKDPDINAPIVTTINSSDSITVFDHNEASDFFKVMTPSGASGYCMKKYVAFSE